jgi:hypothetical protein
MDYGRCLKCGRRVKNRVYHKGLLIFICPRHLKGKRDKEISKYLDKLLKYGGKSSEKLYEDIVKNLSILDTKISTLSDRLSSWMKIINQRRLDEYRLSKDVDKLIDKVDLLIRLVDGLRGSIKLGDRYEDEISFLNRLLREYDGLHYTIEDGLAVVKLKSSIEPKKFRELNERLRDRGYVFDDKAYKWIKSLLK